MYCKKCGTQVFENTRFCPNCNMVINGEELNITEASTYEGPLGDPSPVLAWGILGLAFAITSWLSLLGLIFSIVGLNKAKRFLDFTGGVPNARAAVGRKLSIAGIIVSCIMLIILTVLLILAGLQIIRIDISYHPWI